MHVLHHGNKAIVVDPGELMSLETFLAEKNLSLVACFVTHEHADHIGGLQDLLARHPDLPVYASHRGNLASEAILVKEDDIVSILDEDFKIIETPGHTREQIAFWGLNSSTLFSGDLLFHLGCGRVFDGTLEELFSSLSKIRRLPDSVKVYTSHDYTLNNEKFCRQLLPQVPWDKYPQGHLLPLSLGIEKQWNPFLTDNWDEFQQRRVLRNSF